MLLPAPITISRRHANIVAWDEQLYIHVNILDDLDNVDVELAGVFSVALSVVDMLPAGVSLTSSVAIVEIIDNDEAPAVVATLRVSELSCRREILGHST